MAYLKESMPANDNDCATGCEAINMFVNVSTAEQIDTVTILAHKIWHEYFGPMIPAEALDHIIENVQSKQAITSQIEDGYDYYLVESSENEHAGYFAISIASNKNELVLSKLYFLPSERGKGLGRNVINHLENVAKDHGIERITLTVFEKNVQAMQIYESMGFTVSGSIFKNLGNGVELTDYTMEKKVT